MNASKIYFMGEGFVISNLYTDNFSGPLGLFGNLESSTIDNLILDNVHFTGNGAIGAISGTSQSSIFTKCIISGSLVTSGSEGAGSICGNSYISIYVRDCINYANISGKANVGGIVGRAQLKGQIENVYNYGDILSVNAADVSTFAVGGIVGLCDTININNSYAECSIIAQSASTGGISGNANYMSKIVNSGFRGRIFGFANTDFSIGGLVGYGGGTTIEDCFALAEIDVPKRNAASLVKIQHLVGEGDCSVIDSYTELHINYDSGSLTKQLYYDSKGFNNWVQNKDINRGYPFPKILFAVGGFSNYIDVKSFLVEKGFSLL